MTRVFLEVVPSSLSRGIHRVADALRRYAPADVEIVSDRQIADLVVLHVIGWGSVTGDFVRRDQRYAVIQYCYQTTEDPTPHRWVEQLWSDAAVVWSYYDLPALTGRTDFPFFHAPLGVDADVFRRDPITRALFTVVTSGFIAETEGAAECAEATRRIGGRQFHLGPHLGLGDHVLHAYGISDAQLADIYSGSRFVAGLRRGEGFELPAAEGLLCGARPVMFDAPHYRAWFDGFAWFVPEASPAVVTDALEAYFRSATPRISEPVLAEARNRFDWATICAGFWERVR